MKFIDVILSNFKMIFSYPEPMIGLILPFFIGIILFFASPKNKLSNPVLYASLFLITMVLSFVFKRDIIHDGMEALTFPSFSLLTLFIYIKITKQSLSLSQVFNFTFYSSVFVDILGAPNDWESFLYGIGGAGYKDGLLIIPILYTLLFLYFNWNRSRQHQDRILVL